MHPDSIVARGESLKPYRQSAPAKMPLGMFSIWVASRRVIEIGANNDGQLDGGVLPFARLVMRFRTDIPL